MQTVIRDTVQVEVPYDINPIWMWNALHDQRVIRLVQTEQLMGECFIESRNFDTVPKHFEISMENAAFTIKDISISVCGEIKAVVEWFNLSKYHVMNTYGNLHYVVRAISSGHSCSLTTIDCIAKKN